MTEYTIETFFKSQKFLSFMRMKDNLQQLPGGTGLAYGWDVNVAGSPNTIPFDGDDTLPINSMNANIIRAEVDVKKYADALVVLGTDSLLNSGSPDAVADLITTQTEITLMSLADRIALDIVQNTQALNSKGLNGLAEAIDNGVVANTYAGINRTTFPAQWKAQANYLVQQNATTTNPVLTAIQTLDLQASIDAQRPNAYFTNILTFALIQTGLYAQDRFVQPDMARAVGGYDVIVNGSPLYMDFHMPTGIVTPGSTLPAAGANSGGLIYGINDSYNKLIVGPPGWYFDLTDWQMSQTNLTYFTRMLFAGNLVILKPQANWVAWVQTG